ncbi:MAG: RidA family protein [Oligoflexales bacterium]
MASKVKIQTEKAPQAIGPYSQAIKTGDMVFCSGQIPLCPEKKALITGDICAETHQVLKNLRSVLEAAGSHLNKVVKTTIFLKNLENFSEVNKVYAEYFEEPFPARSTVEVAKLPLNANVEIEAVAKV